MSIEPAYTEATATFDDERIYRYNQAAAKRAELVIVGWGGNAKPERERQIAQLLADIGVQPRALGLTKGGSPGHPLYIRADVEPLIWHAKGLR